MRNERYVIYRARSGFFRHIFPRLAVIRISGHFVGKVCVFKISFCYNPLVSDYRLMMLVLLLAGKRLLHHIQQK